MKRNYGPYQELFDNAKRDAEEAWRTASDEQKAKWRTQRKQRAESAMMCGVDSSDISPFGNDF